MNFADHLKDCLIKTGREELGIPILLPVLGDKIQDIAKWALTGPPVEGRQFWFAVGNAEELRNLLSPEMRGRILPIEPSRILSVLKRGPFDALLLPIHGFFYSDPNLSLSDFWKQRGKYEAYHEYKDENLILWIWKSNRPPLKLFGIDHHHAVLWDVKQILRPLGARLHFVWLSDGRAPVNEAMPCQIPSFLSSLDIYKTDPKKPLGDDTKKFILEDNYDGVVTSHSLITCYRFKDLNLPMIHVNSTRFGNEWIHHPDKHKLLVESIQTLLQTNRLHLVHNNEGDLHYLHQYIPRISPRQEIIIPSLCESVARLRQKAVDPQKFLIWDTRLVLIKQDTSPFMKMLYIKLKQALGEKIDSQATLLAQRNTYIPEGYLDSYTAVIHIPYNISTMSMFQQVRANIPIWVPSQRLLAELWADSKEPNELSWTTFVSGSESKASYLDNVRKPEVIQQWIDKADFYKPDILPLVLHFDSVDELLQKLTTTDYQALMDKAEETQQQRREEIIFGWEQVLKGLKEKA